MPIYQFSCQLCNHTTEEILHLSEIKDWSACENCGGPTKRIISLPSNLGCKEYIVPSVIKGGFKGSWGEYQTFKKKNKLEEPDSIGGSRESPMYQKAKKSYENQGIKVKDTNDGK